MITRVRYESATGEVIRLNEGKILLPLDTLRSFRWRTTTRGRPSGRGGTAGSFTQPPRQIETEISVRGNCLDFHRRLNEMHEITEKDVLAETPGRLYVGDQYITCFFTIDSEILLHSRRKNFLTKKVTILAIEPYWTMEVTTKFVSQEALRISEVKRYYNRYPYRYGQGFALHYINNRHYGPAPAVITIYGPAAAPTISIGGVSTGATATISASERMIIDQVNFLVYKIGQHGDVTNLFDLRNKMHNPFRPIAPGTQPVQFNGDFSFDITLHYQRSELRWM